MLTGFLNGQPVIFFASAYGSNTMLVSGTILGLRAIGKAVLPAAYTADMRPLSAASAAAVGAGVSVFMFGPRHLPRGAATFGLAGLGMQWAWDEVQVWREREAAKIAGSTAASRGSRATEGVRPAALGDLRPATPERGKDAGPTTPAGSPTWLPFTTDKATADARRLKKLKARLAEIDEQLGVGGQGEALDPRMQEVWELEKRAEIRR